MFHDSAAVMIMALCILTTLSIALVNWSGTSISKRVAEVTILFLEVSVEFYAIGYRLKFLRWRREIHLSPIWVRFFVNYDSSLESCDLS
jgi:hypothetical protein